MTTREQLIVDILKYIHLDKDAETYIQGKNKHLHLDIIQAAEEISQLLINSKNNSFYSEQNKKEDFIADKVKRYKLYQLNTAFTIVEPEFNPHAEIHSYCRD